jgi:hypothetical protein
VEALSQPQVNVSIKDLTPGTLLRGAGQTGAAQTIKVPADANVFTLILNTDRDLSYPHYEVAVSDQQGKSIWRRQGLHKDADAPVDYFTVQMTRRFLPAGQYHIKLYGLRPAGRTLLEAYDVRIQYD